MARTRKLFVVHPGEILKTEFMEPRGVSAYTLAKGLRFPGISKVSGVRQAGIQVVQKFGILRQSPLQDFGLLFGDWPVLLFRGFG